MINFFYGMNPYLQSLIASLITFLITLLGSSVVFLFKKVNNTLMNSMMAASSGIMLSAAIFSLLIPAINESNDNGYNTMLIIPISFLISSLILLLIHKVLDKYNNKSSNIFMLILSIVLHNIPEGMSIGVAFASAYNGYTGVTLLSAISLTIAIGIQNFPEGAAVSLPLRNLGYTRFKSFMFSTLAGLIEIPASVIGALLVLKIKMIFPYMLTFASSAMMLVVISDLMPEAISDKKKNLMVYLILLGFTLMMLLEL